MKHRRREPGSGVSSTKSNITRAMRVRIPKKSNFSAMRNQQTTTSLSEQHASTSTAPAPARPNRELQIALVEVHPIMDSKLPRQILISCLHQSDPAEREMWKFTHHQILL